MPINPTHHSLIVRMQAEYSAAFQATRIRYVLEVPASGEHRGFAEVEDLMSALRIEMTKIDNPIVAPEQKEGKSSDHK